MRNFTEYHFDGQKKGEIIMLVAHRHWFNIGIQFILVLAMLILFIFVYVSFPIFFPELGTVYSGVFNFFASLFLMLTWVFSFTIWIDYYLDVWIITEKRIVNVEQRGLFNRQVSELEHIRVQDVTTDVKGFFPTFLNYGDVFIQTAGEKERFNFESVPNPYAIKDLIMKLQKEQSRQETDELGEMIQKKIHDEIR